MIIDTYSIVAEALVSTIEQTFVNEGFTILHDHLHESVGHKGTRIGVSPIDQMPQAGNMHVMDTEVLIQFYGKYDKSVVDPDQRVDPRKITGYAARLRSVIERANIQSSGDFWYLNVVRTDYPADPLGNKTRFEMRVRAKGANSGLVETA